MRAFRFGIAGAFALVEAALAITVVASSDHDTHPWLTASPALTAGLTFVAAGLVALWRRPENATGKWLAATGYLWFLASLTDANDSALWTAGFIFGNLGLVCFAALVLAYPDGILCTRDRLLVAGGAVVALGGNLVVVLLDETPATQCDDCPTSAIAVASSDVAVAAVNIIGSVFIVALLITMVAILVGRWRAASPTRRRALRPVYVSCSVTVVLLLLSVATDQLASRTYSINWFLFLVWFAIVPMTFLAGVLRTRFDRASAARMLVSLDEGVPLRDVLADALHDPSLEIVFWNDRRGWIDESGHEVPTPEPTELRSVTMVDRGGHRTAALLHDPALDSEPDLVRLIAAGASLPLENVRLQADLRAQFLFLETVTNTAPSLLVVIDTNGRILNQNRATVEASGYPLEDDLRGQYFWDVFIEDSDREAMQQRFHARAPDYPDAQYENAFTNQQGEDRVIEWRSAPVADATGRVTTIVLGGIDITERNQREVQLQRERDITATLMQAIPSLIIVVDNEGTIVDSGIDENRAGVNNAVRSALGWPDEALVRRSVLEFIDPGDAYVASMMIAGAANGVTMPERESRWLRADGGHLDVAWTATAIDDVTGRKASLVLLSGVDVTERKRQEAEIRASRARIIEAAGEARQKLERNLHDGAQQRLVSLSVSLRLADSLLDSDRDGARQVLAASREELAAALEELRELARGIHPAVLTDQGLAAAIEALAVRTPLPIEIDLPTDRLPAAVEAAAYYVVSEALTNVVKYAGATRVTVTVEADDDWANVTVVDDGIGGADASRGTGLAGLRDRVEALDGTFEVASDVGGGTRISAEMPLQVTDAVEVDSTL